MNSNAKYQYIGVGVVIVPQVLTFIIYPSFTLFYWDYLCIGK